MLVEWSNATTTAVTDSLTKVIAYIPNIIAAIVVLLIGIIVAWAVKTVVVKVLGYVNLSSVSETVGLNRIFTGKVNLVGLLGDLVQWITVIVFLIPAFEILNLNQVNEVLQNVVAYVPNVVAAVFILLVGVVVADLVSKVVTETSKTIGAKTSDVLADVARYSIVVFVSLAAISQLGVAQRLIESLFTGLVAMVAIAGGIAFGFGGQDTAKDLVNRLRKNLPKS
ncbi:MAG: hypothetical protein M1355_02805 [Patescibacteria group bacterium]|nr:hypothetical protein [Patescibacteria group bacterium]MCL5094034.1 hypothetical protein [Patescibacteria group bacterium]